MRPSIISPRRPRLCLCLLLLCHVCLAAAADIPLSRFDIIISPQASATEENAARELQEHLTRVCKQPARLLKGGRSTRANHFYIGWTEETGRALGTPRPRDDDESFTCRGKDGSVFIYGGAASGTMYGVFTFMQRTLGVSRLATGCTSAGSVGAIDPDLINLNEGPAFAFRHVEYYAALKDQAWCAHNRENGFGWNATGRYGNMRAFYGNHTLKDLLPAKQWFDRHPEYFALRQQGRVSNGQPCLSNKQVENIVYENLCKTIGEHPGYFAYGVAQNDNQLYCECESCRALERKYGGHAGLVIWFVNKIAERIKKPYPDVRLTTLAYQYTRQAPTGIRPADNVIVRLCDYECCFAHPLEGCAENQGFMKDLKDWAETASHLYVWDYVVDFGQYIAPYPNLDVLAENLRTFRKYGVEGVKEQGQNQNHGGEFAELKAWLLAQLLWNPYQDADSLSDVFVQAYYGKAAPKIKEYLRLCRRLVTPTTHFRCNVRHYDKLFTDDFIRKSTRLLGSINRKELTQEQRQRVDEVRAQVLYLRYAKTKDRATLLELLPILQVRKTNISESVSLDSFMRQNGL